MRLIAFTYPEFNTAEESILSGILPYVDALHIRKEPSASISKWEHLLDQLPKDQLPKIWIHRYYDLAIEYGLGGVHLTRDYLDKNRLTPEAGIQQWNLKGVRASITCRELGTFISLDKWADRIFIAPVFESISKKGHAPDWDIRHWSVPNDRNAEIIALGGVDTDKLQLLRQKQFDGVAVLGALWTAEAPLQKIIELKQACEAEALTY